MSNIVYKACQNSIVTMELLPDSITNEEISNVAKFRTNKVKVVSIVNPETNEKLIKDCSIYDETFIYEVGKIIETDFNSDIHVVCSEGIHYFKTYEAALDWYNMNRDNRNSDKTNGRYIEYYENGQKFSEKNYKGEKMDGKQKWWYVNGKKYYEVYYKDGKMDGKEENYFSNGQKCYENNYKDEKMDGKQERWYENGQKEYEWNYKNGQQDGKQKEWYSNGQTCHEMNYKNGQKEYHNTYFNGKWHVRNYM